MYGEDIELQYRAMRAGWERWYVPDAIVRHEYQRVIDRRFGDRRTLWHLQGMARFVRLAPGVGRAAFVSRPQAPFSIGTSTMLPHSVHEPS